MEYKKGVAVATGAVATGRIHTVDVACGRHRNGEVKYVYLRNMPEKV